MKKVKSFKIESKHEITEITLMIQYGGRDAPFILYFSDIGLDEILWCNADGDYQAFTMNDLEDLEVAAVIHNWMKKNLPSSTDIMLA